MSLQKLVVIGAGGFAREVVDVIDAINSVGPQFETCGYLVDEAYQTPGQLINDLPLLGSIEWLRGRTDVVVVCGIGAPEVRRRMVMNAEDIGCRFATLVHPQAVLTRWISLGEGSVITAGCILTNQISIGRHVHVNLHCTIGHDAVLEDFSTLAPGVSVSGRVCLGQGCYIGTGANIIERRTVGPWSVIGAGSTIVNDLLPNTTSVGSPARVIKSRPEGWHLT
jgi:sugar O-acyltransferase (sialic acid O-acetyltransferase NeuD family)